MKITEFYLRTIVYRGDTETGLGGEYSEKASRLPSYYWVWKDEEHPHGQGICLIIKYEKTKLSVIYPRPTSSILYGTNISYDA